MCVYVCRQRLTALQLPLTHCTVCNRALDGVALDFAELAFEQQRPSSGLRRVTGAVFSALCGHRPPFCCTVALNCRETAETYVRYHKDRLVREAPVGVSCDPSMSYVGGSLRLLRAPELDPITQAFQNDLGYDAKPFLEMSEACRSLLGVVVSLKPQRCSQLNFCTAVSAEVKVYDFSRGFCYQDSDPER